MKQNGIILSAILGIILLLGMASATQTAATTVLLNTPANGGSGGGTMTLNSTVNSSLFGGSTANITWYAKSASTANSSWVIIATNFTTNFSITSNDTIKTFSSLILEDSNDYIFNVTYQNGTGSGGVFLNAVTTASVTIDNTVPNAATLTAPADRIINYTGAAITSFASTVVDNNTISCNITGARGDTIATTTYGYFTTAGSYSGTSCTATHNFNSGNNDIGTWLYRIDACDGTNCTASSTQTMIIQTPSGGSPGASGGLSASQQPSYGTTARSSNPIANFIYGFFEAIRRFFQRLFNR